MHEGYKFLYCHCTGIMKLKSAIILGAIKTVNNVYKSVKPKI